MASLTGDGWGNLEPGFSFEEGKRGNCGYQQCGHCNQVRHGESVFND